MASAEEENHFHNGIWFPKHQACIDCNKDVMLWNARAAYDTFLSKNFRCTDCEEIRSVRQLKEFGLADKLGL